MSISELYIKLNIGHRAVTRDEKNSIKKCKMQKRIVKKYFVKNDSET